MLRTLLSIALLLIASGAKAAEPQRVYLMVLGVAQDAGYPQAGCYRPHCMRAWRNSELRRRTSSIAIVDETAGNKYLIDATPDIREQLFALHGVAPDETFDLAGVFLTHGHMGHYTGLMHFGHEAMGASEMRVFAMPRMRAFLSKNGPWDQLVGFGNIRLEALGADKAQVFSEHLSVTPFVVPHRDEYTETVGYRIDGPDKSAVFIPDIDKWERWQHDVRELIREVDYALVDATFFADGELPGRDMSKIPHPFVSESMALFEDLSDAERARVIFIHMNHTNPLLIDGSDAQAEVERRGFRIAREGMQLDL